MIGRFATPMVMLLVGLCVAAGRPPPADEPGKDKTPREEVVIGGETFRLELAVDEKSRNRGLGGRRKLDDDGGMLFVFPDTRRRSFWMKDCLIDIDLIYLDDRGRIVRCHEMKKEPPRGRDESMFDYERRLKLYASLRPVRFVIELRAGSIKRLKLEPRQTIALDLDRLKKLARRPTP